MKSFAALVLTLLLGACRREQAPAPEPTRSERVRRGDVVVFEQTAADFREGRVLATEAGRLRVEPGEGGDSIWISSADVYVLGEAPPPDPGELAICREQRQWLPCRIEARAPGKIRARAADERTLSLGEDDVLAPRPVTVLNIKRRFDRAAERRRFLNGFARAGDPVRPPRWVPGPHARVLGKRDGRWYSAKVHEYDEEVPRVAFLLDERVTELSVAELAPELPYDTRAVKRGDFVLVQPPGPAEPFRAGEIRGVGDQEFRVGDADGVVRVVPARDVVPLAPVTPPDR